MDFIRVFTDHIRSTREGNVVSCVCPSVYREVQTKSQLNPLPPGQVAYDLGEGSQIMSHLTCSLPLLGK